MMWNDGTLPYDITEEDLKITHMSKPRNTLIAYACFLGGYIDSWGRGTIKIIDACKANNMPAPEMRNEQGGFVTIFHKPTPNYESQNAPENAPDNLTALQFEIIELIKADKGITYQDIANKTSKNRTTIMRNIAVLKNKGLIKRIGPAKGGHWEVIPTT